MSSPYDLIVSASGYGPHRAPHFGPRSDPHPGPRFRRVTRGIERLPSSYSLPRHRHLRAYSTVVLAGAFEESGYTGRIRATAGDVLIHSALDCHANQMISAGVSLIRLGWSDTSGIGGLYHLDDVDDLARTAETDVVEATLLLEATLQRQRVPSPGRRNDWPDRLLTELAGNPSTEIGVWAEVNGLARETVSRGFAAAYGAAPSVLRAELRTRAAWLRITRGTDCLSRIAADTGFADQADMTRWVHRITGAPPSVWRRNVSGHTAQCAASHRFFDGALQGRNGRVRSSQAPIGRPHSACITSAGLTRAARRAGTSIAATAGITSTTGTATNVTGSCALIP
jgi:AraC-like DNA-binding protein